MPLALLKAPTVAEKRDELPEDALVFLETQIEEHMYPVTSWQDRCPSGNRMAALLLCTHLTYAGRFQLTLFMLNNKCRPTVYVHWLLAREMLWDERARGHVAQLIKDHMTGKLEEAGKTSHVMDATLPSGDAAVGDAQNWVVQTPHFAYNDAERLEWENAIRMLNVSATKLLRGKPKYARHNPLNVKKFSRQYGQ